MKRTEHLRVSNPPPKPLLIWDGDCDFCRLWIERWREMTAGNVDCTTSQEGGDHFPEIPPEEFNRSLVLIQPDGTVLFAAEAAYRSLGYGRSREWLAWSYDHVPGFAAVSETGYGFIARHRQFASAITRLLWGKDVRRPTYFCARRWFLRTLGMIYLIAFVSLWVQVDGLVGSDGISPASQFLSAVRGQVGPDAYRLLPTLCWFNASDAFLHFLCGSGVLCSLLLIFGIAPALLLVALFVFVLVADNRRPGLFQFSMGRAFARDRFFVNFFCAVAAVAEGAFMLAEVTAPGYSAGFAGWIVFAQASFVQIDAHVGRGEINQRRRQLVEPDSARLPLLVATVADGVRLVGGQKSRMVQTFLGGVLPRSGNHRAIFHLGAAPSEINSCRTADFPSIRDRDHGKLLLFQPAHNRAVLIADRRFCDKTEPPRGA